jgi:hypothetical protein
MSNVFELGPACRAEIRIALVFLHEIIVCLLIEAAPNLDFSDDFIQRFVTFRTYHSCHATFSFTDLSLRFTPFLNTVTNLTERVNGKVMVATEMVVEKDTAL